MTSFILNAAVIHPDKCTHERAPDAFDLLKKVDYDAYLCRSLSQHPQAESDLSDPKKREELDAIIKEARITLLRSLNLPTSTADSSPALAALKLNPPWQVQLRAKVKETLIEEEVRRRKAIKMNLANEGLEARKKDEEVAAKKRKAEEDKVWEGTCPSTFFCFDFTPHREP